MTGAPLNIIFEGLVVRLAPRAALAFGMAVQELAPHAVRYGALSAPSRQVAIEWLADAGTRRISSWTGSKPAGLPSSTRPPAASARSA